MKVKKIKLIKRLIAFFITVLFLSGLTAIPIDMELSALIKIIPANTPISQWMQKVLSAYKNVNAQYPFLLY